MHRARVQVEAKRARKEREELLGRVEAALWKKDPESEPPMGLSTMSNAELREVLAGLNGGLNGAAAAGAPPPPRPAGIADKTEA